MANGGLCAILLFAAFIAPGYASAMSNSQRPCQVAGEMKLPAKTGGSSAICDAVEQAIAARAPKLHYSAKVQVLSKSALKATVTSNGRTVAQQELSVMDRDLNATSIERFAKALAEQIAKPGTL
jgi:hypothetical protein